MKNILTLKAFAEWAETKPPEETYNWWSCHSCACGQYAEQFGLEIKWLKVHEDLNGFWNKANMIARETPHTFGALAQRLRQA